jgi:hypothetical protein
MAYLNWLASIPVAAIPNLKSIAAINQHATASSPCSHLIASWVVVQPLGRLLGEALDGGDSLPGGWRHRLRGPKYHLPDAVCELSRRLHDEWQLMSDCAVEGSADQWYSMEIDRVLRLFRHTETRSEAVVSYLEDSYCEVESRSPDAGE